MRSLIQPTQRVLARATGLANATTLIAAVAPAAAAAAAVSATGVAHQRLHAQPARIFSAATILRSPAPAAATTPAATAAASAGGGHSPSSGGGSGGGTAIVMLNMGGPSTVPEVGPFLTRLFSDPEIIALGPFQKWAGPLMAKRRTPKIEEQYAKIGGSPIRRWTELQGREMVKRLDKISPQTAPHKFYVCFRYAAPLTSECLESMSADGMTRAVAFSQYPQFSCTTTGSSLNHLWRELIARGMESKFKWSLVDRWAEHPTFIAAVQRRIELGLAEFGPQSEQDKVLIVFSAHSLPMRVVARGDAYPQEVSATVAAVMRNLRSGAPEGALNSTTLPPPRSNRYILAWQSQVGPLPWLGPQTGEVLAGLGAQGHQHVLVVPIAFTSDHVETLYEIDEEYAHLAAESGIKHFRRAPSLNDEPLLADAMAQLVAAHLKKGDEVCTEQYGLNCAGCTNPICKSVVNPVAPYQKLRDQAQPDSPLAKNNPVKQQHLQQF